ncbi:TrbG/VirB9 family P-type conjugative transfer protein [Vibrio aerogenes]|uniref:TrbG/VirB9 family P-type conjugative transfer protein n=1 Tax=Vibrio aerogenes TaxID=92172 RepID=UPI0021C2FAED|nr:TrbG/VirB9 family P-type conjugative transfer protein [Vibrio aerogenes]
MIKHIVILAGVLVSTAVPAAVIPKRIAADHRIVSAMYDPSNVVIVRTKAGTATLIQLEAGETIRSDQSGLGIGDAEAWGLNVRGSNIFFKPKAAQPDTNLTVVSDKGRTYSFQLTSSRYPFYIVRMRYPEPVKQKPEPVRPKVPCTDGAEGHNNFRYSKWGNGKLAPQYAWDDGRFTCMKFATNQELPVIYAVDGDGKESLVNYHIEQDTVVIHSVAEQYRLRLGDSVLGIKTGSIHYAGYNDKGSTIDAKRIIKPAGGGHG